MASELAQRTPSQKIIGAMGGIRAAARVLNKSPTTVQYWYDRGIPHRHQQLVLEVCRDAGVMIDDHPIEPAHFFSPIKAPGEEAA